MKLHYLFSLLLCFGFLSTRAQTPADRDSSRWFGIGVSEVLDELNIEQINSSRVSSASKVAQRTSEAPGMISVVQQRQIQQYGWLSANQVLYRLPGFSASQDYDRRTVSSRGLYEGWNNNHLLMLIDGVPFNDNLYGTAFTWEVTPLAFTRSLEVLRGPGASLYGSNATNGVITLNTITPNDLNGIAEVRVRGGRDLQMLDVIAGGRNDHLAFVSSLSTFHSRGNEYDSYDASGRTDDRGELLKFRTVDERKSMYLFNKLEGKGKLAGFSFQHHEQRWSFGTGHGWLFYIPDLPEQMNESRRMLVLKYATPGASSRFTQEYTVRYQKHHIQWNMRFYPNNTESGGIKYPNGVWEQLATSANDVFSRVQFGYRFENQSVILGGVENTVFLYNGDETHLSNIDLSGSFLPFPDNQLRKTGAWLAWIKDNPVLNTGAFVQYISRGWLRNRLKLTMGLRYDRQTFRFNAIDKGTDAKESRTFDQLNPRLSLVYMAGNAFTFKAIAGRAFRTPAPSELFGANTYTLSSNLRNLVPENITTYELSGEWKISPAMAMTVNTFLTNFENQIAYSVENANLSTNVYSLMTAGMEAELIFTRKKLSGFLNYSYAQRLNELILDNTISMSKHQLTWTPGHLANLSLSYREKKWYASLQQHYSSRVQRRSSDRSPEFDNLRGAYVKAMFTTDLKISCLLSRKVEIGVTSTNLLNYQYSLIKVNAMPFDYRAESRRVWVDVKFGF